MINSKSRMPARLGSTMLCACLLACSATLAQDDSQRRAGRIMPPASIVCDRNQLTSWTGLVSAYQRDESTSWLQISTDENTVESTEINYFGEPDAANSYRIRGERFVASDWPRIEQSDGVLIEGMRATAWICEDGQTTPVIDWRPPQD